MTEVLFLGVRDNRLCFRRTAEAVGGEDPTSVAVRLAAFTEGTTNQVLHSTSWRFDAGTLVLTYVGLPDPDPSLPAEPVPATPVRSNDPLWPNPEVVAVGHVAAHACGHLAFLRRTDPTVAAAAKTNSKLWSLIDEHAPTVAGLLTPERWGRLLTK